MFQDFLREKQYLINVSPRTLEWYEQALGWLTVAKPKDKDLKNLVIRMREKGLKARSINSYRTAINSYMHWTTGVETPCSPQCNHPRIPRMRDEQRVPSTFKIADVQKLIAWKPKRFCDRRLHTMLLTLADTGCRIDEVLALKWSDVDFDNLLITVIGKEDKQRRIPFSLELRKRLFKWKGQHQLVFSTRDGKKLGRRNMLRDTKRVCRNLGIQAPARTIHAMRHTFAVTYLRRGGSVFHLQKALGHSTLDMTRRYANLLTDDLQKVHESVSLA
jgi:integrase/recombinase XerD